MNTLFPIAILAGGLATRLRPLTEKIPKALVNINGKPFIEHQLRLLRHQGIRQVVICVGFLGEMIQDYVKDGAAFGLDVQYSFDGNTLLGTAGALKKAIPLLGQDFLVIHGDSYLTCDFQSAQNAYQKIHKPALMTVFRNNDQWDKSNIQFENGEIISYDKINRTSEMHYIDYGLGVFNQAAFEIVPDNQPYDLAVLFQTLLKKKQLSCFEVKHRFYEIGSLTGIEDLNKFLMTI